MSAHVRSPPTRYSPPLASRIFSIWPIHLGRLSSMNLSSSSFFLASSFSNPM